MSTCRLKLKLTLKVGIQILAIRGIYVGNVHFSVFTGGWTGGRKRMNMKIEARDTVSLLDRNSDTLSAEVVQILSDSVMLTFGNGYGTIVPFSKIVAVNGTMVTRND